MPTNTQANTFGYLLHHASTILARQYDAALQKQLGIGMAQFKILMILRRLPSPQQSKLAECLGQTEASISRQIKLLAKDGLLEVTVSPENRRQHLAHVTPKGATLTAKALEVMREYSQPVFAALSDEQQTQLQTCLQILHQQVCAEGKPFACDHSFRFDK